MKVPAIDSANGAISISLVVPDRKQVCRVS